MVPLDDLDAIEKHNLEVADVNSYPVPLIFPKKGGAERPEHDDLIWDETALRALPVFFENHHKSVGYR